MEENTLAPLIVGSGGGDDGDGDSGVDVKATEDYTKETAEVITRVNEEMKNGKEKEGIEELLALEKKCRQGGDGRNCSKICCFVLNHYKLKKEYSSIEENVFIFCKKRGQLKRTIIDIVKLVANWIENDDEIKAQRAVQMRLIECLTAVTEGKIFVEVERAKIIKFLSAIKEAEGNIEEAASLLQDLQIETFGGMDRIEKTDFVLNQMRLVLKRKDFIRLQIISRKLNPRILEEASLQDQKMTYYDYLLFYHLNENEVLNVCKDYYAQLHTPKVLRDASQWHMKLQYYVLYLLLAPYDSEQNDLLNKLLHTERKRLQEMPTYLKMTEHFLKKELLHWPLEYEDEIKNHPVFTDTPHAGGADRWKQLRKRVVQHNIRIFAIYYSQIRIDRIAELLGVERKEIEAEILELVNSQFLIARINRPAGIVRFEKTQEASALLSEWAGDVTTLLTLLDESSHLIQKERMVHAARAKKAQLDMRALAG